MSGQADLKGADLEMDGLAEADLSEDTPVEGHAAGEGVIVVRRGADIFAIGAHCSHYGGPPAEGAVTGDPIRCPWHHARFDLGSGQAVATPALSPVACWKVERRAGRVFVGGKVDAPTKKRLALAALRRGVGVGAGAGGAGGGGW